QNAARDCFKSVRGECTAAAEAIDEKVVIERPSGIAECNERLILGGIQSHTIELRIREPSARQAAELKGKPGASGSIDHTSSKVRAR
ncbi:MAG TPA: hypothetical protein VGX21_09050, partial [Methylomirabilota bacterium]|nr:hypothetical protein [Methylomirabilota bacterium]